MAENHSAKTASTIELMKTNPEAWGIAPMTVRKETRDLRLPVKCPVCRGNKYVYGAGHKDGQQYDLSTVHRELVESGETDCDNYNDFVRSHRKFTGYDEDGKPMVESRPAGCEQFGYTLYGHSVECWNCTGQRGRPTGKVVILHKDHPCNIHTPAWPAGTEFTSRFNRCDCEACGKNNIKSGCIPVMARTTEGGTVGMFVGNACVKRFGLQQFKTADQQASRWIGKGLSSGEMVLDIYERSYEVRESISITTVSGGEFPCPHCDKVYKSRAGRYNHLKNYHQ